MPVATVRPDRHLGDLASRARPTEPRRQQLRRPRPQRLTIQGNAAKASWPQLTPVYLCDFLPGFLAGYGAMLALAKRAREGGSYRVQVSLCQSAMLQQRQGLINGFADARAA